MMAVGQSRAREDTVTFTLLPSNTFSPNTINCVEMKERVSVEALTNVEVKEVLVFNRLVGRCVMC